MNKACKALITLALTLSLPALSACGPAQSPGNGAGTEEGPLHGARIGGDFTLTDQDGKSVRWQDFKGKYRLVYFGYTYCPDICPVDMQAIILGLRQFEKQDPARAAMIQPIFITVDPQRDTPAVIKQWVRAFDPRLVGLTGTPEAIEKVKKDFAVYSAIPDAGKSDSKNYLVDHSRSPYLMDPDGAPIALVPTKEPGVDSDEGSPASIAAFLTKWVK